MAGVSVVNVCMVAPERMCPVVQAVIKCWIFEGCSETCVFINGRRQCCECLHGGV